MIIAQEWQKSQPKPLTLALNEKTTAKRWFLCGAGSRTRTYEALRREIYSLLWLPLHDSSKWSRFTDSNRGPAVYKTAALTNWAKAATITILAKIEKYVNNYHIIILRGCRTLRCWRRGWLAVGWSGTSILAAFSRREAANSGCLVLS